MEIATVVIQNGFDKTLLEQIDTLRTIRLGMAENMLQEIESTASALESLGFVGNSTAIDRAELRKELQDRIAVLRARIKNRDVIYEDEISFYVDLL